MTQAGLARRFIKPEFYVKMYANRWPNSYSGV